jgi:hypothetical protein
MRKSVRVAALVVTSAALVVGVVDGPAQAGTRRELNLCWSSRPLVAGLDLDITADGPSFRQRHFDSGECKAYDVKGGQYKVVVTNLDEVAAVISNTASGVDVCGALPAGSSTWDRALVAKIRRQNKTYIERQTSVLLEFTGTNLINEKSTVVTNVRDHRRTSVSYSLKCTAL